jgi:hypothetical protein
MLSAIQGGNGFAAQPQTSCPYHLREWATHFKLSWTSRSPPSLLICSNRTGLCVVERGVRLWQGWNEGACASLCLSRVWRHWLILWWAVILLLERAQGSQPVNEPSNLVFTSHANWGRESGTINMKKTLLRWKPLFRFQCRLIRNNAFKCVCVCVCSTYIHLENKWYEQKGLLSCFLYFQCLEQCLTHRGSPTHQKEPSVLPEHMKATHPHEDLRRRVLLALHL